MPASGPSLTANCIWMVGGSMGTKGRGRRVIGIGDGFADEDVLEAGQADDVAGVGFVDFDAFEALEMEDGGDLGRASLRPSPWMQT